MCFMPVCGETGGGRRMLNSADAAFIAQLEARLGGAVARPCREADIEEPRGLFKGRGAAVLCPASTQEVSTILAMCNTALVPVVPLGGGTGLVGGQVMADGPLPVLLSLERMTAINNISQKNNTMTVEAGVVLADIHTAAEGVDRLFPLTLASEGSCRIGGNLATNAGGVNVLRYGNASALCLGLEAVLADGTVIGGLKRLRKDNTGYDIGQLMIGSEGSLGVITAAVLRLFPKPAALHTAFLAVSGPEAALRLLHRLQAEFGDAISGFELIHQTGFDFLDEGGFGLATPLETPSAWSVLLEIGGAEGLGEVLQHALAGAMDDGLVSDAVLAQNEAQRCYFWQIRETIPAANKRIGSISSHDISVPVSEVPAFITRARSAVPAHFRVNCFGHMGDGNLHYNIFPPKGESRQGYADERAGIARLIFDIVADFDGSFSAEHGIGRLKVDELQLYGNAGKLNAMRRIKAAFDPNGIMNPGVVLKA